MCTISNYTMNIWFVCFHFDMTIFTEKYEMQEGFFEMKSIWLTIGNQSVYLPPESYDDNH